MHKPFAIAHPFCVVVLAMLVASWPLTLVHAQEDRQIDFSKYDKDMLLLVIDQMQKRILSLERENELLREKLGQTPSRGEAGSAASNTTPRAASGSDDKGKPSAGTPARESQGKRTIGRRGVQTQGLQKLTYDPQSNRTYIATGDRQVESSPSFAAKLSFSASFEGKQPPAQPKSYTLAITVTSSYRHYSTHHAQNEMSIFLDGEEIKTGIDHYQYYHVPGVKAEQQHNEYLNLFIKPDLMARIANAQSVTFKTIPRSFELDAELLQAVRDLNDFFAGR